MEVGQLFGGRFRLLEVLGQGSFGVAWKAREEGSGLLVVLKVLRAQAARSERERERFRREVLALRRLSHRHIVLLVASGRCPDSRAPFFATHWSPGRSSTGSWPAAGR